MNFFLDNCVTPLVGLLRDYLLKHVLYVVQVGDNVEKLNQQASDLDAKRKTVVDIIEEKERTTSQKCTKEVEHWLEKAANILDNSREIQRAYDNKNCMLGTNCSFNCCSNYSIGKRAFNMQVEVGRAMDQINPITNYVCEMVAPKWQRMNTMTESGTNSQLELLRQKALLFVKDDTQGTLGIWGMGGVGKTTLLKLINNSLPQEEEEVNKFYCIFVVASQGCTKKKLQELIADNLKLPKDVDLSKNIFDCLKNKDFVLFVDDLWEPLDLKDIGIPYPLGVCNEYKRKVILTTRSRSVCGNMGTGRNVINVQCLEWDEAWALFKTNVGQDIIDSANPRIRTLAEDVARECGGLPLALKTVGRAMSQNETVDMWENALDKLSRSQMHAIPDIQGTGDHSHTLSLLSVSYDYLETSRSKECFLLCALWPEDFSIEHDDLIRCWMGHGLLDGFDNISQVYREGKVVIDTLLKACLLEQGEKIIGIASMNGPRVKMHDLTRDMARWVARDRGDNKKKWLVCDKIEGLAPMIRNQLHVTTLIIRGNFLRNEDLENLQYCSLLQYLDVSGNGKIEVIPVEMCTLEKLEYIDFTGTSSKVVPLEMKNLTNLKYVFLGYVRGIADGVLSNLTSLLVLDMYWYGEGESSKIIDELGRMGGQLKALAINVSTLSCIEKLARLSSTAMTSLKIERMSGCTTIPLLSDNFLGMPHMHSHLKKLGFMECDSLEEIVMMQQGGGRRSSCRLLETEGLILYELPVLKEIVWSGVEPVDVFPKLRCICIYECNQLEHVSWVAHLPCLEVLVLSSCHNLSHVVVLLEQVEAERPTIFPTLQKLELLSLPSLISIVDQEIAFPSLGYLRVLNCEQLKKTPKLLRTNNGGRM